MTEIEVVTQFIDMQVAGDAEGMTSFLSDNVFVHYKPMEPVHSKEEWKQRMMAYDASEGFKVEILNIVGDGNGNVLTERVDSFRKKGVWIDVPIMGAFTVRDGLIVNWREYYDLATFTNALAALDEDASKAFEVSHLGGS